jgi:Raf kinase inhibitor-like YbhB/YbcL family protein
LGSKGRDPSLHELLNQPAHTAPGVAVALSQNMASTQKLTLTSPAFSSGGSIPKRFSEQGDSISPELRWSGVPSGTREFALICQDPDAPTALPFVHWIIYGISANTTFLPQGLPTIPELELPILARQGLNTLQKIGFTGPNPPGWDRAHRYIFQLFALDEPLPLAPGIGHTEFFKAIEGHVLDEAVLVGKYQKESAEKMRRLLKMAAFAAVVGYKGYRTARPKAA